MNRVNQTVPGTHSPAPHPQDLDFPSTVLVDCWKLRGRGKGWKQRAAPHEKGRRVVWQDPPAPDWNEGQNPRATKWQEKKNCEEEPVKSFKQISSLPPFQKTRLWNQLFFLYKVIVTEIKTRQHVIHNNPECSTPPPYRLPHSDVLLQEAPSVGNVVPPQPAPPRGSVSHTPFPNPELESEILLNIDVLNNHIFSL